MESALPAICIRPPAPRTSSTIPPVREETVTYAKRPSGVTAMSAGCSGSVSGASALSVPSAATANCDSTALPPVLVTCGA